MMHRRSKKRYLLGLLWSIMLIRFCKVVEEDLIVSHWYRVRHCRWLTATRGLIAGQNLTLALISDGTALAFDKLPPVISEREYPSLLAGQYSDHSRRSLGSWRKGCNRNERDLQTNCLPE